MSEPAIVFRTLSEIEASVVRGLLEAHGIEAFVSSEMPRGVLPLTVSGLGELRVSVPAAQAEEARVVIADYRVERDERRVVPLRDAFRDLEARIGYRFRDRALLEHALTHRSHAKEDVSGGVLDNESLEFLGDAILGFVVAERLFHDMPEYDEGHKSKIKAALVSAPSLARIADRIALGEYLFLGRGEEKTGGRQKGALVSDACEALIAAIYLDGGLDAVRGFLLRELGPLLERAKGPGLLTAVTGDFKSALQEFLQARDEAPPEYRVVSEQGPDHDRQFEVEVWVSGRPVARASGRSKKDAAQDAARRALIELGANLE